MSSTTDLYGQRKNGISHGDVFTSRRVVSFMLDLVGYTPEKDLSRFSILEPCSGNGEFLAEIQRRIILSAGIFGFDGESVMSDNVFACEIDPDKFARCVTSLQTVMKGFIPKNFKNEDFLLSDWNHTFDFIVGNPPYVRFENIPVDKRNLYKSAFDTFHYRCDLYVLFYEHSLKYLKEGAKHCFICSNRWLKNKYGRYLRKLVASDYNLDYLIDIEDLDAFQEAVLAYPAITVVSNRENTNTVRTVRVRHMQEFESSLRFMTKEYACSDNWDDIFLTNSVGNLHPIERQGFSIGIGVATGADKVYMSSELPDIVENDLLIPVIGARDLTGDVFNWKGRYLLNPYQQNGNLIDLDDYPKAKQYLESHRQALQERYIVKRNRPWYSLIDKVKPSLTGQPKILLPDISGNNVIFIDKGRFYPAHNIYYITGSDTGDLEVLAAILMSSLVSSQIASVANKMNGGMPRWQSQSIKKLRIPLISKIRLTDKALLKMAYQKRDFHMIDKIIDNIVPGQATGRDIPSAAKTSYEDFRIAAI